MHRNKGEIEYLCGNPDGPIGFEALPPLGFETACRTRVSFDQRAALHDGLQCVKGGKINRGHCFQVHVEGLVVSGIGLRFVGADAGWHAKMHAYGGINASR